MIFNTRISFVIWFNSARRLDFPMLLVVNEVIISSLNGWYFDGRIGRDHPLQPLPGQVVAQQTASLLALQLLLDRI